MSKAVAHPSTSELHVGQAAETQKYAGPLVAVPRDRIDSHRATAREAAFAPG